MKSPIDDPMLRKAVDLLVERCQEMNEDLLIEVRFEDIKSGVVARRRALVLCAFLSALEAEQVTGYLRSTLRLKEDKAA